VKAVRTLAGLIGSHAARGSSASLTGTRELLGAVALARGFWLARSAVGRIALALSVVSRAVALDRVAVAVPLPPSAGARASNCPAQLMSRAVSV
jgi:hypothetical protein